MARLDVTAHRHGRPPLPLTGRVTRVAWSRSITAPWEALTVMLKMTLREAFSLVAPGDWIALRTPTTWSMGAEDGAVLAFCHVDDVNSGIEYNQAGTMTTDEVAVTCTSWWNLLQRVNLYAPKGMTEDVGTLLSMASWSKSVGSVAADYVFGSLGVTMEKLFRVLAAVKLPESVAGGLELKDLIPIVHDHDTRDKYAPGRVVESVSIGGGLPTRIGGMLGAYESSVGEIFSGCFVPEPMLIELFPSFEPFNENNILAATANFSSTEPQSAVSSDLAKFLGGWQTLVYRVKPFRTRPLREAEVAWPSYQHVDTEKGLEASWRNSLRYGDGADAVEAATRSTQVGGVAAAVSQTLGDIFDEVTWDYSAAAGKNFLDKHLVRKVTFQRSDMPRLNASSIVIGLDPANGIEALTQYGLPITYDEEIRRHGLRVLKPTWTFVIPGIIPSGIIPAERQTMSVMSAQRHDFVAYLRSVCAQFMQFYKNAHLYSSGQIQLNLLDARELKQSSAQTFADKVLYLKPGETIVMVLGDRQKVDEFYAYAETITHQLQMNNGGVESAATTVSYTRGHFGVEVDALVDAVQVPTKYSLQPAAQRGDIDNAVPVGVSGTPGPQVVPADACSMGAKARVWLETIPVVTGDVLSACLSWAELRAFEAEGCRASVRAALSGTYGSDVRDRQAALMCAAYVVECYWRERHPDAVVNIIAGRRADNPVSTHNGGDAMDFSVLIPGIGRLGAFQTWGAMRLLCREKRLPWGGVGLYLNVSDTGIFGVEVNQAGLASRFSAATTTPDPRYPSGGSDGVHYDFGKHLGGTSRIGNNRRWIDVDTDNDGHDNLKTSDQTSTLAAVLDAITASQGQAVSDAVKSYYGKGGKGDPFLHAPTGFTPNLNQVLGLEESCFKGGPRT